MTWGTLEYSKCHVSVFSNVQTFSTWGMKVCTLEKGNKRNLCIVGRRPFKQLPTDELFCEALFETLTLAFENTIPRFVLEDLNTPEDCRVIDLWTNTVRDYEGYMRVYRRKQERKGSYSTFCFQTCSSKIAICAS